MKLSLCISAILLFACAYPLYAKDRDISFNHRTGIYFLENKGQLTDQHLNQRGDIDFSIDAGGMNIFVGDGQIHYQWMKPRTNEVDSNQENTPLIYQRLDVELIGANTDAVAIVEDQQAYYENHYRKDNGEEVKAHTYNKVTYKNIYPNIDWVLYTKNNQLKYDFIVHKGGDAKDIKIKYNGADKITMQNGTVTINTSLGSITEQAPYSYDADSKETIASSFVLEGNTLSFNLAKNNGTTIIDPWLEWATYYGGSSDEKGTSTACDYLGNVYLFGHTLSHTNIATVGRHQDTLTNIIGNGFYKNKSGFIVKFDSSGVRLWATYYPGHINAGVCDAIGTIYITGNCDSIPSIATTGAHQTTSFAGQSGQSINTFGVDAFIAKLDSSGSRIWGTFYGGNDYDDATTIAIDSKNNIYVGGFTQSKTNIATLNSFQDTFNNTYQSYISAITNANYKGKKNGWFAKFNTNGARQWGTYHKGLINSITIDNNDDIIIVGSAFDSIGISTFGKYQTQHTPYTVGDIDLFDGFINKFSPNGSRIWGTYYGGTLHDEITGVDVDTDNNIYVVGNTRSTFNMTTNGAHQTSSYLDMFDIFVAKFSSDGSTRIWSTYYGGSDYELSSSINVSHFGKVYITGFTQSSNNIATSNGLYTQYFGRTDNFLAQFDLNGNREWATYYGGSKYEDMYRYSNTGHITYHGYNWLSYQNIATSILGRIYFCNSTLSTSFIATNNGHQTTLGFANGNTNDAYLVSLVIDTLAYIRHPFIDSSFCVGDTLRLPYGVNYPFLSGNNFTAQLSDSSGSFTSPTTIGSKLSRFGDTILCVIPAVPTGTGYRIRIVSTAPVRISADNQFDISIYAPPTSLVASNNGSLCIGDSLSLTATHTGGTSTGLTYQWLGANNFSSSQKDTNKLNVTLADTGDYILTVSLQQCTIKDTTHVAIYTIPTAPQASSSSPVCFDSTLNLFATHTASSATYTWVGVNSFASTAQNPIINNTTFTKAGDYIVRAIVNGCISAPDTTTVVVNQTPKPTAGSNSPVCSGQPLLLSASNIANATYSWTGPNGFSSSVQNPVFYNTNSNAIGTYYVLATVNGCESLKDSVVVVVNPSATVSIFPNPGDSVCVGEQATFIALATNAGSSPSYTWLNNGIVISGATSTSYSTTSLSNGDVINCVLSNVANCPSYADTSNSISMTVSPVLTPSVTISANPSTPLDPNQPVMFTAPPTNGGNNPTYQWTRNGTPISGAIGQTWGANANALSNNDDICVIMHSNYQCPNPDTAKSNCIKVQINVGFDNVNNTNKLQLFPNPNKGTFTLQGETNGNKPIQLSIINSIGQTVYQSNIQPQNNTINQQIELNKELAAGVYLLQLRSDEGVSTVRMKVE